MKKIILTLLTIMTIVINLSAQSQKENGTGKFTQEELDMKFCSFDVLADAVVLSDYGNSKFMLRPNGIHVLYRRHKRIKIFKESAYDKATINIPYYAPKNSGKIEKVKRLKAHTYKIKNGKVVEKTKVDPKSIFTERLNENWSQKKFVFPNLAEGVILEYSYEVLSPFIFQLPSWTFQTDIPTIYSQYQVEMIHLYEYVSIIQGLDTFDEQKTSKTELSKDLQAYNNQLPTRYADNSTYTYVKKEVPAFLDEAYITSKNDYIMKIKFQLSKFYNSEGFAESVISTWPKLNQEFKEHRDFGLYIKKSKKLAKKIFENNLDITNLNHKDKVDKIIDYVKQTFVWNGIQSKFASESPKTVLKNKTGNSAEINLFLIGMLQEAGINTKPLVLSTRDHGKMQTLYPFSSSFNYVIGIMVNEQSSLLVDATEKQLQNNIVPTRCFNELGLVINDDKDPEWITINYNKASKDQKAFVFDIDTNSNTAKIAYKTMGDLFLGYSRRKRYEDDKEKIKESYIDELDTISNIKTQNYNDPKKKYIIEFDATKKLEKLNDYIVINPFLNLDMTENFLFQKERTYPVDMIYPTKNSLYAKINIPEGYKVNELPQNINIKDETMVITTKYNLDQKNNQLTILCNYNFKQSIYQPELYQKLKNNLDITIDAINTEIVLEPK